MDTTHHTPLLVRGDRVILLIAIIFFCVTGYFLFFETTEGRLKKGMTVLGKISTRGVVRRRHAGSLYWSNISGEATLYLRDTVYTPMDTTAEVIFNGNQKLELEPDSMVQFDEITVDKIQIVLKEGKEKLVELGKPQSIRLKTVTAKQETPIRILPYPKTLGMRALGVEVDALEKVLQSLTADLKVILERKIALASVVEVRIPEAPQLTADLYELRLISPNAETYDITANPWIKMSWEPLPLKGVSYQLEMARNPYFSKPLHFVTKDNRISVPLDQAGHYYWRVRGIKGTQQVLSRVFYFEVEKRQVRDILGTGGRVPANFLWEVFADSGFEKSLRNSISDDPICPTKGLERGVYYCRIRDLATNKIVKQYPLEVDRQVNVEPQP
jgi:hypothetical protein